MTCPVKCLRRTIAVALLLAALNRDAPASANGPTIGQDAGGIFPIENTAVQLVTERVEVALPLEYERGQAVCTYVLRNITDTSKTFDMSFLINAGCGDAYGPHVQYDLSEFAVEVNGRSVPVTLAAAKPGEWSKYFTCDPDALPVWTVSLEPGQEAAIRISHIARWSGWCDDAKCEMSYKYLARSAALWANAIESATIAFALGNQSAASQRILRYDDALVVYPGRPSDQVPETILWNREKWEPQEDLELRFHWRK